MAEPISTSASKLDAVSLRIERAATWVTHHWQQVLLALGALLAAGALTLFVALNLKKLKALAWDQLTTAQSLATQGRRAEALQTVDQLLASTRTGVIATHALLFRGDVLLLENRLDESAAAYEEARRQATTADLRALADAGAATALEQAGKWPEAEERAKQFIKDYPEHFLAARQYESLGRIQMIQQKWPDAQATLERLVTLYPTTPWAKTAQDLLSVVKVRLQNAPAK